MIRSYSSIAAKESRKSERTIENEVKLGAILEPYADKILGSPIENSISELGELVKFTEMGRIKVLELISSGKVQSVADAFNEIMDQIIGNIIAEDLSRVLSWAIYDDPTLRAFIV